MDTDIEKVVCWNILPVLKNSIRSAAFKIAGDDPFSREAVEAIILHKLVEFLNDDPSPKHIIHLSQMKPEVAAHFFQVRSVNAYLKLMKGNDVRPQSTHVG